MSDFEADFESRVWDASNHPALCYQAMLADGERMRRYRQAIEAVVRPGDVVADLGTGLGVLALMAVQAGAARVYAIDLKPASLWLAEKVIRANGAVDRIRLVLGDARSVTLDEPVDVIVNELIGNFGTDEGIHESVRAFAASHLAPGGRIVPERLRTWLVPVEYGDEFRGVYREDNEGLDLRAALSVAHSPQAVIHTLRTPPRELAPAALVEEITFSADMPAGRAMEVNRSFRVEQAGPLQGFVGYFDTTLSAGVELSTWPAYAGCHWEHWHWPVQPAQTVAPGDAIATTLRMRVDQTGGLQWKLDWRHRGGDPGGSSARTRPA